MFLCIPANSKNQFKTDFFFKENTPPLKYFFNNSVIIILKIPFVNKKQTVELFFKNNVITLVIYRGKSTC